MEDHKEDTWDRPIKLEKITKFIGLYTDEVMKSNSDRIQIHWMRMDSIPRYEIIL